MRIFLRRLLRWLLLAVIGFGLITACQQKTNQNVETQNSSTGQCRIIQHGFGELCIPQNPQNLIALGPAALGNMISLGVKPLGSVTEYNNQFPAYLESKTAGVEAVGSWGGPSLERITLLKPDLMIGWKRNYESIYPQLSNIAPTALYDWHENNTNQDNWKEYFNFVAEVIGQEDAAKQVWQHYEQRIEQLKQALGDRYQHKTISFVNFCCGGINSETENSFIGSVLSDAGLQRPESQRYNPQGFINISEEALEMADGDVMFVVAYGGNETGEQDLSRIQQTPLWQRLNAVQQNRVYYVDPTVWRARTLLAADAIIDDLFKYLIDTP